MAKLFSAPALPPVQSTAAQSIMAGGQATAQMYGSIGKAFEKIGSAYFEKKDEDKQIEALANRQDVLEMVYRDREAPADPKERKKDIKALFRGLGGRTGVENYLFRDAAEQRAAGQEKRFDTILSMQQQAHDQKTKALENRNEVLMKAFAPTTTTSTKIGKPTKVGEVAKKGLGGLLDPKAWEAASGRLGHPLSVGAARAAKLDPSTYLKGLEMPPSDQPEAIPPQRSGRERFMARAGEDPFALGFYEWTGKSGKVINAELVGLDGDKVTLREQGTNQKYEFDISELIPEDQEGIRGLQEDMAPRHPYLGEMIGEAGRAIGEAEIPGTEITTATTTKEDAPFKETTMEGFIAKMQGAGLRSEHMPYVVELAKMKPSAATTGSHGISSLAMGKTYYSKAEATRTYRALASSWGIPVGGAAEDSFLSSARIVKPTEIRATVMKEFKDLGLDKQYNRHRKVSEVRTLLDKARTNSAATPAFATAMARIYEPSGMLTDQDISRYVEGDRSVTANIERLIKKSVDGKLLEADLDELAEILTTLEKAAHDELEQSGPEIAKRTAQLYDIPEEDVYKFTALEKMTGQEKPKSSVTLDDALEKAFLNARDGETVQLPDGKGGVIEGIKATDSTGNPTVTVTTASGEKKTFGPKVKKQTTTWVYQPKGKRRENEVFNLGSDVSILPKWQKKKVSVVSVEPHNATIDKVTVKLY